MDTIAPLIKRTPRPVRYIIVGGTGFLTAVVVLAFLVEVLHLWYLTASLMTFVLATFVSFMLQKKLTFQNEAAGAAAGRQMAYFYSLAAINAGVNSLLLYTFVDGLQLFYLLGQFFSSATIAVYSFFFYRYLFQAKGAAVGAPSNE